MRKMYQEPQTETLELVGQSAILTGSEGFTPPSSMPQPAHGKLAAPAKASADSVAVY